jgi:hypothetical protein
MEDYQNLEIDRAVERLQTSRCAAAATGRARRSVLARVHMSLGIVAVGVAAERRRGHPVDGPGDLPRRQRRARPAAGHARDLRGVPSGAVPGRRSAAGARATRATTGGVGQHRHAPVGRGRRRAPAHPRAGSSSRTPRCRCTSRPTGALTAEHVYVHFRGNGMRAFERREMTRVANGYGTESPLREHHSGQRRVLRLRAVDAAGADRRQRRQRGRPRAGERGRAAHRPRPRRCPAACPPTPAPAAWTSAPRG